MLSILAPSIDMDGDMTAHSHCYHHICFPRFGRVGWIPRWCKCNNHATRLSLRLWNHFNDIKHPCHVHIQGVLAPSIDMDGHMAAHSHHYHHRDVSPRFGRVGWNHRWCKCNNHATMLWLKLQNLSNCIPHPWHTYVNYFSTFNWYGWAGSMFSCSLCCDGRWCEMRCCEMLLLDDGCREEYVRWENNNMWGVQKSNLAEQIV